MTLGGPAEAARDLGGERLTARVLASFDGARSSRYRDLMTSLVRHLHAFVDEVGLTEEEWAEAIEYLTRTGDITDDKRQEFILLSDVLGVSMMVIGINHHDSAATESTVFGPFFVEGAPRFRNGDDIAAGATGKPCFMRLRILGSGGEPLPAAAVDVWLADEDGLYDVQREGGPVRNRGRFTADAKGQVWFWSVLPEAYPIPTDGPVGELLDAAGRGPMRPAHVHFMVNAKGYEDLITHVFVSGDPYLDEDAVFGVKNSLIAPFELHPAEDRAPDGRRLDQNYYTLEYDLILATSSSESRA